MRERILNLASYIVKCCFLIFTLLLVIFNISFSSGIENGRTVFYSDINIQVIASAVFFGILLAVFCKKDFGRISKKKMIIVFLTVVFLLGLYWIFSNDVELKNLDDAYNVFNAAKSVASGNYSSLSFGSYISTYPNNLGLLTYEVVLIKTFGELGSLYAIRCINILFVAAGFYAIYLITDLMFNDHLANKMVILLMLGSLQFVFYASFVYGNCISYSLSIISVYFLLKYLKDNDAISLLVSVLTIIGAIFIKSNSIIVLIAELIYLFLKVVKDRKIVLVLVMFFMLCGCFACTSGLEKYWGRKADINYGEVKLPTICWIAYGINYDQNNPGHYFNSLEQHHVENGYVPEFTKSEANQFITSVIARFKDDPRIAFEYYCRKFIASWCDPTFEAFDQHKELELSSINRNIVNESGNGNTLIRLIWNVISLFSSIGTLCFCLCNRKNIKLIDMLCATVILGGFFFHAFWEIKAVYLYQYYLFLLPYAAKGIVSAVVGS